MSIIRNLMATGLVALTLAGALVATPALAHGGGHGGGGHSGGFDGGRGGHFGDEMHADGFGDHGHAMGGDHHFGSSHHFDRRNRFFSNNDDNDVFYDQYPVCQLGWGRDRLGHLHRTEICS